MAVHKNCGWPNRNHCGCINCTQWRKEREISKDAEVRDQCNPRRGHYTEADYQTWLR